jgi:multicomponent Na+:H+ antiporter subunit D
VEALPALVVAVPLLVAAVLAGCSPWVRGRPVDLAAIVAAAVAAGGGAVLLARAAAGPVVYWFGGWTPRDGVALGIAFAVDPVGAGLATLAGVLATAALVFSWRWAEATGVLYHSLMLVFLAAIVGFCLSGDLFNMFVFYELFSVSAFALAGYRSDDPGSLQGALNFAITNTVGAFLLLAGIALLYGRAGALNLAQLGQALADGPADGLVVVAFLLVMVGFFVKAAVVPFHFWLADAYALAPTPAGVLFAGAVSELGLYAVARVYWTVFSGPLGPDVDGLRAVLLAGAVTTALVGGVMCLLQHHLVRMLAYATVSHVGLTLAGVALLSPAGVGGAMLYAVADGLVKGALFLSVGVVQHHLGGLDELALAGAGRGRRLRWAGALLVAGALGLAAIPPFGSFLGKALMEEAAGPAGHPWLAALFLVVSAMTVAALLRAVGRIFLAGTPGAGEEPVGGRPRPRHDPRDQLHPTMLVPAVLLLAAAVALGLVPGLAGEVEAAAARFTDRPAYAAAVLTDADPAPPAPAAGPGYPGGPALWSLLSALLGLAVAVAWLVPDRLPGPLRAAGRAMGPSVAVLRGLHSGFIADSVTWLVVGMAGFGGLLALVLR